MRFVRAALTVVFVTSLWGSLHAPAALAQGGGKPPAKGAPAGKPASAEPKDKARDLYRQGAKAIDEGKHAEGLALIEQAEALFHAPTHTLLIAKARIALGRLLEAREAYQKLADEELAANASDGFKEAKATAKTELVQLDKRIPKLRVLPEPADASGLTVLMNEQPLAPERLSAPIMVNPGSYVFDAKADGLEAARVTIEVVERTTSDVRLVLNPIGAKRPAAVVTPPSTTGWPTMKIAGVALIAGGGAGLAAGGALGVLHFTTASSANDKYAECGASCRQEVESLDADAALFGNIAIGALAGGAALLGTGILLFALAPAAPSDDAAPVNAAQLRLSAGPSGLALTGSF